MSKLQKQLALKPSFRLNIKDIYKNSLNKPQVSETLNSTNEDTKSIDIKESKKDNCKKSFDDNNKDKKRKVSEDSNRERKLKIKNKNKIPKKDFNNIKQYIIIDVQIYHNVNKKNNIIKYEKKTFKEDLLTQQKNNQNLNENEKENDFVNNQKIKSNENNNININVNSKNIFINNNSNQNPYNAINNKIIGNQINFNVLPFYTQNNLVGLNSNQNIYNFLQYQHLKIINQKKEFQSLKQRGLLGIYDPQNKNNYLYKMYLNNNIGIINNINNINQLLAYNNSINQLNYNYYGNQNLLLNNYFTNQHLVNINRNALNNINSINSLKNLNNISGQNIPEQYTIIIKNKTKNPDIQKLSKIKVTTTYLKDKSKNNQEIKEQNTKEKNPKNIINIEDIISGKENRTVVRLNPIPPNYSSFDISKLLDKYLNIENGKNQRIYKAIYTPLCKIIGKNLGYCFIMMAKPKYVIDFYKTFNGRIFQKKKCKRPCNVIWADIQGNAFLKTNEDDPIRKPIIFKDIKND